MVSFHRPFADGNENVSGYFLWKRPTNGSAKPEGLKRAVGQTARFRKAGARGLGERSSLGRVKGRQLIIWVQGRSVLRGSRERPSPSQ